MMKLSLFVISLPSILCIAFFQLCCNAATQSLPDLNDQEELVGACFKGDALAVGRLVKEIGDLNFHVQGVLIADGDSLAYGPDSWTPLTAAIVGKRWAIASFLIGKREIDPNLATIAGYSPIWLTVAHSDGTEESKCFADLLLSRKVRLDAVPKVLGDLGDSKDSFELVVSKLDVKFFESILRIYEIKELPDLLSIEIRLANRLNELRSIDSVELKLISKEIERFIEVIQKTSKNIPEDKKE